MSVKIRALWTNDINEVEDFLDYKLSSEMYKQLEGKIIKNCSEHINPYLDECKLVICYVNPENQCYKYNQYITIIKNGISPRNLIWKYNGISYISFNINEEDNTIDKDIGIY